MPRRKKDISFSEAVRRAVKLNSDPYDLPFTVTIAMRIVYAAEQGDMDAARLIYDILKDTPYHEPPHIYIHLLDAPKMERKEQNNE